VDDFGFLASNTSAKGVNACAPTDMQIKEEALQAAVGSSSGMA
jgi:hypothetical protein